MNNKIVNDPEKIELTLYQGVLNDDHIMILKDKWYFVGHNKAQVKITYYTYATEWSNRENTRYFRTLEKALKWYKKEMLDRVILQGACWLAEDPEEKEIEKKIEKENAIDLLTEEEKSRSIEEWENLTLYCEI